MADHREVRYERLYVKVPGQDRLRKAAGGRLRHLLADGWREIERNQQHDFITVHLERTGHVPLMTRIPKPPPMAPRPPRDGRGGPGGRRGGPGFGPGRGAPRGPAPA
jgi:hypothetical protein